MPTFTAMQQGRTAILYFAYRPESEAVRKPIFKHHSIGVNAQFYRALQDNIFDSITPLALPLIHVDERQQRGDYFGERITNAVEQVWDKGFERVLIIGNDCPELNVDIYQKAMDLLDAGKSCLVATQHGGAGLIGISRKHFYAAHWLELEWQSKRTFDELFDCLADCRVLDLKLNELNGLADAYVYAELHRKDGRNELAQRIEQILNPMRDYVSLQVRELDLSNPSNLRRRGPPFHC